MTTLTQQIPQVGQSDATEDVKLANNVTLLTTWANGNIDGVNVSAALTGRRLIAEAKAFVPAATATGTYFVNADGTLLATGGNTTKALNWWTTDPGNYTVTGKANTQVVLRTVAATNGIAPGASCNVGAQLSVVTFSGATGNLVPAAGASQATVSFGVGGLTASSFAIAESSAVTVTPNADAVTVTVAGAATAANSAISLTMQLFVVNS